MGIFLDLRKAFDVYINYCLLNCNCMDLEEKYTHGRVHILLGELNLWKYSKWAKRPQI
jgi:hypothetical protein